MKLREYQKEDVEKLTHNPGALCFNEQRTGKTPTAIHCMMKKNITNYIVVCPTSTMYNWAEEIQNWAGLNPVVLYGTKAKRDKLYEEWNGQVPLIISYGTFKSTAKTDGEWERILKKNPNGIIIDEAHRIKNRKSANAKAIFKCTKIPYRLLLTGTPAANKQEEIWSLLHVAFPHTFNSYWKFIENFFIVETKYGAEGRTYKDIVGMHPKYVKQFQLFLDSVSTQRKRKDVMQWLPEKDIINVRLEANKNQKRYLKELKDLYETEHVITQGILDRLIRYRQICLHPQLLGLKASSPKLDWILEYLKDYPDRPTIIFSKFTTFIQLLENVLKEKGQTCESIVGSTPAKTRTEIIKRFQSGKTSLLLLNIDACKEGITLDRAEAIIFTDKYPPVSDILQAEDRFIATTKANKDKPHVIYNLIIKDSYDEHIYRLITQHAAEVDIINDYKKYLKGEQNE